MKANIHPTYYPDARVICACGNTFTTGSTKPEIRIETCSKCHPFYTGQQRFLDTAGSIEKFKNKQARAAVLQQAQKAKKAKAKEKTEFRPKSLKEMLTGQA